MRIVYIFTSKFTSWTNYNDSFNRILLLNHFTESSNQNKLISSDFLPTSCKMDGRMRAPQKSKRIGLNNKQLKVRSTSKIPEFETDKRADKKSLGK